MKIGIFAFNGKMSKEVTKLCSNYIGFCRSKCDIEDKNITYNINEFLNQSDVIIDFSLKDGTNFILKELLKNPKPIVCGTTALMQEEEDLLKTCSKKMPVFYSTNMSLGIAVLNKISILAAKLLKDFDIEVLEMHHKHKKDAPSGTTMTILKNLCEARKQDINKCRTADMMRQNDEIGYAVLRGGDVAGEHRVGFYGDGELIEITHRATSRATFAKGAVEISKWLINQKNGFYEMKDYLD